MQNNNKRKRELYENIIGKLEKNIIEFDGEIKKYNKKIKKLDLENLDEIGNKNCKLNFQGDILEVPKNNYDFSDFLKTIVRKCDNSEQIPFINIDIRIIKIFIRYFNKCKDPDLLKKNFSYQELLYFSNYLIIDGLVEEIKINQRIQITHQNTTQTCKIKSIDNIKFTYTAIKIGYDYGREKTYNIKFY